MRDRESNARHMARLIERWRRSGQALSAFARAQGETRDKLEYWRRRLDAAFRGRAPRRQRKSKPGEITFSPVKLVSATVAAPAVEVTLPSGVRLAIGSGATPELVGAVMEGLRHGC